MNFIPLDVETTISNDGNPFDRLNKLVCIGIGEKIFYKEEFNKAKEFFYSLVKETIFIGFNIKFDLHWLKNIGFDLSYIKIWDCQLAEFILSNQSIPYPSLDRTALAYNLPPKIDKIKNEYWSKGIDTDQIPRSDLTAYLKQDLLLTYKVFLKQQNRFKQDKRYKLFRLQCADLLCLQEMEYNGIYFETEKALQRANELQAELDGLYKEIVHDFNYIPINLNSPEHISCLLYGGIISVVDRIPVGVFKSGKKVGETRYKKLTREYSLPRIVEPLKGTELQKEGYWRTDEKTLKSLKLNKQSKKLINTLMKYSELEKLITTYMIGYSKLIDKMNWPHNMLHGNLNQCVVKTGRLSSTKPNLQNANPETKKLMRSRYEV